ncbi:hypothetical protein BU14_0096s0032 [Porphyra umbilicalis]|uniref:Uncharacterized protein n=1 Tax=Porphyra umbilicalis TaxID=2786 RepID=A0A1X6PD93_PORUM|nr:hypothetical protein BU14_0096s0032 [Porphyra umbilicalis]|eukprot:OSX78879.1 hypothetical protein BU14_0096s0032 [Porphyra umbilicalis]
MMQLALHVSRDAQVGRGHLLGFQAATAYRISPPQDYTAPTLVSEDVPLLCAVGGPAAARRTGSMAALPMTSNTVGCDCGAFSASVGSEASPFVAGSGGAAENSAAGQRAYAADDVPSGSGHGRVAVAARDHPAGGERQRPSDIAFELASTLRAREEASDGATRKLENKIDTLLGMVSDVKETVQENTQCTTAYHARMEGSVGALLCRGSDQRVTPQALVNRPRKRGKTAGAAPFPNIMASSSAGNTGSSGGGLMAAAGSTTGQTLFYPELLHGVGMKPELITATFKRTGFMSQLICIVRLCHVSAGKPEVFGTLVVRGLYTQALCKARFAAEEGRPVAQINIKKAVKVKSIAENKAEDYWCVANWLFMVAAEVVGESATESTTSKLGSTNWDIQAKVNAGISAHALPTHALRDGKKAKYGLLRTFTSGLTTLKVLDNGVEVILSRSPFKERLAQEKRNIGEMYLVERSLIGMTS